jgi:hypothetical protein
MRAAVPAVAVADMLEPGFPVVSDGPAQAVPLASLLAGGPPDPDALRELAGRYGVENVGPPLT